MTQVKNFFSKVKHLLLQIFHKLEEWGEATARSRVERYLAQSQNIVELERRMKEVEGYKTRYGHYI